MVSWDGFTAGRGRQGYLVAGSSSQGPCPSTRACQFKSAGESFEDLPQSCRKVGTNMRIISSNKIPICWIVKYLDFSAYILVRFLKRPGWKRELPCWYCLIHMSEAKWFDSSYHRNKCQRVLLVSWWLRDLLKSLSFQIQMWFSFLDLCGGISQQTVNQTISHHTSWTMMKYH